MSGKKISRRHFADKKAWAFYLSYYRKNSGVVLTAIFLGLLQAGLFIPVAFFFREILNEHIPDLATRAVAMTGLWIFLLLLASAGVRLMNKYIVLKHNKRINNDLRNDLFSRLYDIPKAYYAKLENMSWHTILTQDVQRVDMMSAGFLTSVAPALIITAGLCFVMLYINWLLFVIVLAMAPVIALTLRFTTSRIRRTIYRRRKAIQHYSARMAYALRMMDLTRIQGAEQSEINTQIEHNDMLQALDFETAWLNAAFRTIQDTTLAIITVILLVGGGMAAINQSVSLGDLFTFYVVFMYARKYLLEIFNFIPSYVNGNEALERIYEIVGVEEARPYRGTVRDIGNHDITLDGVTFSYDDEPLLENIDMTIKEGEFVVFEGENGSGKTTLIYLILGFYRPHGGTLSLGGISYDQLDITEMRRKMGVVLQESPVFRGTVLDNITYGRNNLDESAVNEAIRLSGVDRFMDSLPDGLATQVGDEGVLLSGGQRQRIAIARALCAQPRILILDEPTNHLDKRTVRDLVKNLKQLPQSPTVIMINHMDQFSDSADRVFRLDEKGMADISPVSTN